MGSLTKLFYKFSPAFLLSIINFITGVAQTKASCPIYDRIAGNLIGSGVCEFFLVLFLTCFLHRLVSGYDKIDITTKTITYSDGTQKVKTTKTSHLMSFAGKKYH